MRTKGGMHHDPILMRVYLVYDATYRARIVIIDAINPTQLAWSLIIAPCNVAIRFVHPHTRENLSAINIAGEVEKAERLANYGFWSRHMILERNESVQSQLIDIIRLIDIQI